VLARVNNVGVLSELFGAILLVVLLAGFAVRSPVDVMVAARTAGPLAGGFVGPLLAAAALTASYVMYGFDTAGSLAEETDDPRRNAPRAILQALGAAGVLGFLVLLVALMATGDLTASELGRMDGGLPWIVTTTLGGTFGRLLLCDVGFAIVVCALAVHAGAVRLVFAMARDRLLPFSTALAAVSPISKTPVLPVVIVGVSAIAILVANVNLPRLVELVTMIAVLWANLAYLVVSSALLWRRVQGWPAVTAPGRGRRFSLGRLGVPVNAAAVIWSAFMILNVGWPRPEVYGVLWQHRFAPLILTAMLVLAVLIADAFVRRTSRGPDPDVLRLS
jgi:amino acid transporter